MGYKSNLNGVLGALDKAKIEALTAIGLLGTAEAQLRAPVGKKEDGDIDPGRLKRNITFQVHRDGNGVDVGTTEAVVNKKGDSYAPWVEKGTSKMKAQPFLEPACLDNINKFEEIAGQKIRVNMGGK
ncbi:hypothetical protein KM792_10915 [Clostridium tyrobutyricum]|uniref:HK97-gp10 family putative phage morphogenesis protein n=1 Tax=Clostridium tyrobutyricum TaxID=1519 RepID=UPI001C3824B0|nr:HK97-gp10 family putative phage morphogenesis protein [Clostridium tyrobutyricum]MBV4427154.1 hypothetical protein [Clostridium tyrobutyricum]MBV4440105.1 hypothetical protein [Clostridium tyrobutyricum]MBV4442119.1 hypothetical protein [Clostridium tyrobutyricum]MBV4442310.1 hypothetical protein [Clostridium tyrobutyricum]MBV4445311.1 hypothetical protein [Clostridium tyrobutyricum]